jgi:hypothetical protein
MLLLIFFLLVFVKTRRNALCILLTSVMLMALILRINIKTQLNSLLTLQKQHFIKDFHQLAANERVIPIINQADTAELRILEEATEEEFKKIFKRKLILSSFDDKIEGKLEGIVNGKYVLVDNSMTLATKVKLYDYLPLIVHEDSMKFLYSTMRFPVNKKSIHRVKLMQLLERILEVGIYHYWDKQHALKLQKKAKQFELKHNFLVKYKKQHQHIRSLKLNTFKIPFFLLLYADMICFLVFIAENMIVNKYPLA